MSDDSPTINTPDTPMPPTSPDAADRARALNTQVSFAVSAPAGSGKTELLIQRYLKLLAQVERPENILAITFTRKAASEMRLRIVAALSDAQQNTPIGSPHEQHTRTLANAALQQNLQHSWNLLDNPHRLRLQTIDAFCTQIATQLCVDTGVSLAANITENYQESYLRAAEDMLQQIEMDTPVGKTVREIVSYYHGDIAQVATLFAQMLNTRDSWLPLSLSRHELDSAYVTERLGALTTEVLADTAGALLNYQSDIEQLIDHALQNQRDVPDCGKSLKEALQREWPTTSPNSLPAWRAIVAFLLTADAKDFRKQANSNIGFPSLANALDKDIAKQQKALYKEVLSSLQKSPETLLKLQRIHQLPSIDHNEALGDHYQNLLSILPVLAAQLKVYFQETGETDYTEISMTALQALGTEEAPSPLALRLDYRINHILVDEFQDTSNLQIRLLERLTAGWENNDGRTLFIVGDGMQGIYAFRKANVSLFIQARQYGIGDVSLQAIDLTANFRSDNQIVKWVNQSFSHIFPPEDNVTQGQVGFRKAVAIRPSSPWPIQLMGTSSEEAEAEKLADDIQEKMATTNDSFAILVRSRMQLTSILTALRSRSIPWHAQNIDPLDTRPAVLDIHSLTRALCIPADRIAWLSILRAPWCGLSNDDLTWLCRWREDDEHDNESSPHDRPSVWRSVCSAQAEPNISAEGKQALTRIVRTFNLAFSQLGVLPLRMVIEQLWMNLDGPNGLFHQDEQQDISDYLSLLEEKEQGGLILDWPAFQHSLSQLFAKPDSNDEASRLHIMTIHKSKGLEFDHVYLPALSKGGRSDDQPLLQWWEREYTDGSSGYLFSTKPRSGDEDQLYCYLNFEKAQRDKQELARLLYVACTRAKKSLWLSGVISIDEKKGSISAPPKNSLLSILWPVYQEVFSQESVDQTSSLDADVETLSVLRRLHPLRPLPDINCLSTNAVEANSAEASAATTDFATNYQQRALGTLLHDTLMDIVKENRLNEGAPILVNGYRPHWQQSITTLGLDEQRQTAMLETLAQQLTTMLHDETGRWLLNNTHQHSEAELEIDCFDSNDSLQRMIIDRTFVEAGTRWIIDYKSSSPQSNETVPSFLESQSETYRSQLQRYAQLFNSEFPIRGLLYFPAIAESVEVDL